MGPAEIAWRAKYRLVLSVERARHRRNRLAAPDRLERALTAGLRGAEWERRVLEHRRNHPAVFLPGLRDGAALRRLFCQRYQAELASTLADAARTRDLRFDFFGQEFHYAGDVDWQADPRTGCRWPAAFHADVPVNRGDVGHGDVKYVWELNRQQYLVDVAKAFYLTESSQDLSATRDLVRSWIKGNPYATGVNWACALEPAFRAWSWLWAYHLTASALDDVFHLEWLEAFYDHGRFLSRHLEHYSSPYNHLIGEASALYAIGVCFPEFSSAPKWRRQARRVLEDRLHEQFYEDGGSVEQSLFYHHATTSFYLLAALVGRTDGDEFPAAVWSAIERAIEYSMLFAQPDGRTPRIGGADDGKPLRMERLPLWDFRSYQAIGAALFGRPDFKHAAGRFCEDALWVLGPSGYHAFQDLDAEASPRTSVVLQESGYLVSRSAWRGDADYVCFDFGQQAAGMRPDAIPNSMHGHADCLSVIVWLAGREVLVDSGFFAYNCGGDWEAHFRETAAHNTARVDRRDQATHLGKMAWSHSYRAALERHHADEAHAWACASHDGYARGPAGVTHRRCVWRRPGGYVLIHDEFTGSGRHEIEVNYQFAPGHLSRDAPSAVRFNRFADLAWTGRDSWTCRVRRGGPGPEEGWISTSLGVREPAPRLTLSAEMHGRPVRLLTVVAGGATRVLSIGTPEELVGVCGDGWIDWVSAAGIAQSPMIETDARLGVCRLFEDGLIQSAFADGSYARAHAALRDLSRSAALAWRTP